MKKIGIIGAGHPFEFQYNALRNLGYEIILCDKDIEKISEYPNEKYDDYKLLIGKVDMVLVSTPPSTHMEIIQFFLDNHVEVISEKPLVTKMDDLDSLMINNRVFHNVLHFAYGREIEWFIDNYRLDKNVLKIGAFINDPYIVDGHIRDESKSLHGAYLDETINPLSALARIFDEVPKFVDSDLQYLDGDQFDYKASSKFMIKDIPIDINVNWNDYNDRSKYIDIYFEDEVIRLDSINQKVVRLESNDVLYEGTGVRMYNHYLNAFKDYLLNECSFPYSIYLNREILKGVK